MAKNRQAGRKVEELAPDQRVCSAPADIPSLEFLIVRIAAQFPMRDMYSVHHESLPNSDRTFYRNIPRTVNLLDHMV